MGGKERERERGEGDIMEKLKTFDKKKKEKKTGWKSKQRRKCKINI